jgi:hypothetical protein
MYMNDTNKIQIIENRKNIFYFQVAKQIVNINYL